MRAGEKITAMDEMARLIVNYRIPAVILRNYLKASKQI